jgi:spore germination protein YaaH
VFSAWQFALSSGPLSTPLAIGAPPVPTPSIQSVQTTATLQDCAGILYHVQSGDTLASIAHQFSMSKKEIMAANHMANEAIDPDMELLIPLCSFTPTGTVDPTILATTYTPATRPTISTPGG